MLSESVRFKFGDRVLVPDRAAALGSIVTSDGVQCVCKLIGMYRESGCHDRLEQLCQDMYGMSFSSVKVVWHNRLGFGGFEMWALLELKV